MSREIVLAVDIADDAAAVFDAVTTPEGLAAFWTSDVTASDEVGSTLRFGFEPAPVDLELSLEVADRPRRIVWADEYADAELGAVAYTWSQVLAALQGYVETGEPQPALH